MAERGRNDIKIGPFSFVLTLFYGQEIYLHSKTQEFTDYISTCYLNNERLKTKDKQMK